MNLLLVAIIQTTRSKDNDFLGAPLESRRLVCYLKNENG